MTIRLEPELKARLDRLARETHQSRSHLAAEAVRELVELNEWQIQEIKAALKEADEGKFATEQEVRAFMDKWDPDAD